MAKSDSTPKLRSKSAAVPSLSAPFDDVQFTWDASDQHIALEYCGPAERLIECGAIEPHMADKAKKGSGRNPRCDSSGHRFHRALKIMRDRTVLKVVRYIGDQKFAESLPGTPRGVRMKRLDWLDAHPGTIHVITEKAYEEMWMTSHAGRREDLIVAGFPESLFLKKPFARKGYDRFFHDLPHFENARGTVTKLMRGYVEIEVWHRVTEEHVAPHQERPSLRIVVNNEFAGGCTP
jgi:hypothetical protein